MDQDHLSSTGPSEGADEAATRVRPPAHLRPRKEPRQQRSRELVEALVEATAQVVAERGYDGATTNHIAERAGVSVGSLYQYFPTKDALLLALLARLQERSGPALEEALAPLEDPAVPDDQALRCLVEGLVALHDRHPEVHRTLASVIPHPEPIRSWRRRVREAIEGRVADALRMRGATHPRLRLAAALLVRWVESAVHFVVFERPADVEPTAAIDETVAMIRTHAGLLGGR